MISFLIDFSTAVLSQISLIFFFGKLSNRKINIKLIHVIVILLFGLIQLTLNDHNLQWVSSLFTLVYFFLLFKSLYNCDNKESKNYSIIIWTISLMIDILVMLIVSSGSLFKLYEVNEHLIKSIGTLAMSIIIFLISNAKSIIIFIK